MIFTIKWIENRTSAKGSPYAKAVLVDEKGIETQDVTIFGGYPGFSDMRPETKVEGQLKASLYNGKTGYTLEKMVVAPAWATAGGTSKGGEIAKAQAVKAEGIKAAQENRAEGVKVASTARDATLIVAELIGPRGLDTDELIKAEWTKWRKFLWNQWDNETPADLPF